MRWALATLLVFLGAQAFAATHRVAVLVGNNVGDGERPPLHYAESDAGKMARVLVDLGHVAPADLFLLQGQHIQSIHDAMQRAHERIVGWHENPSDHVLLVFYFSGHSDGVALEVGPDRLTYAELRRWLGATGADVQLAIVDSCRSGALIAAKGGKPTSAFDIELNDDLEASGQVFLASSAADESALESTELGASFFTLHFISALRGAADHTKQGRVTLAEAYRYAYENTLVSASQTSFGAQHPNFDYRLSGRGELVITELSPSDSILELPPDFDRALVYGTSGGQVVAELTPGSSGRVALSPGSYSVSAQKEGHLREGSFALAAGQHLVVDWSDLPVTQSSPAQPKGDVTGVSDTVQRHGSTVTLAVGGGTSVGIADNLGLMASARVEGLLDPHWGPYLALTFQSGATSSFRESSGLLLVGYRFGVLLEHFELFAGPAIGGGGTVQSPGGSSIAGALAAEGGAAYELDRRWAIELEGTLPLELLQKDGSLGVVFLPAAWALVRFTLG
jgi:hypothetical protein